MKPFRERWKTSHLHFGLLATILLTSCFESKDQVGTASKQKQTSQTQDTKLAEQPPEQVMREAISSDKFSGWMRGCQHWLDDLMAGKDEDARSRLSPELRDMLNLKTYTAACSYDRHVLDAGRPVLARITGHHSPTSPPGSKIQIASVLVVLEPAALEGKKPLPLGQGGVTMIKRGEESPWEVADYFGLPGHHELVLRKLEVLRKISKTAAPPQTKPATPSEKKSQ